MERTIQVLLKDNRVTKEANDALLQRITELCEIDYVAKHLRKYGVGSYLVTAGERIEADLASIQSTLGLTAEDAIEYLKGSVRGYESTRSTSDE